MTGRLLGRFVLALMAMAVLSAHAAPFQVTSASRFYNHNWFPLKRSEMQAAAVDTALARLTDSGLFQFVGGDGQGQGEIQREGELLLDVSLVEQAETAKITLSLTLPTGSYVSTTSTSLRGLAWQGIFSAFEHIGTQAADRMLIKLAALQVAKLEQDQTPGQHTLQRLESLTNALETHLSALPASTPDSQWQRVFLYGRDLHTQQRMDEARTTYQLIVALAPADDPWHRRAQAELAALAGQPAQSRVSTEELAALYEQAQGHKRAAQFFKARIALERLQQHAAPDSTEHALAVEELIYGLPQFEAQYWSLQVGQRLANREPEQVAELFQRSENLYRQLIAENPTHPQRIIAAQAAIDQLRISQQSLAMMLRQQVLAKLAPVRMVLIEHYLINGEFPAAADAQKIFGGDYQLHGYQTSKATLQAEIESKEGYRFQLLSEMDGFGVQVIIKPLI